MLIRSQDKKDLINLENITRLSAGADYRPQTTDWVIEVESHLVIGKYSSKTKAIKVLDMIQDAYDERTFALSESGLISNKLSQKVFLMPADEEMED
jgi:hypothetical protein